MNTPTIETARLILRRFTEDDLPALYRIYRDEEANRFLPWFPVKDMAEARTLFQTRYAACYAQPRGYAYAICLKRDSQPIGYLKADTEEPYDLGYGLRREFWHQGITTEAGRALVERVKKDGLPYLTATHDVNNPRSGGVMKRLGMVYQYSYEEQWQPKDFPVIFRMYQLNLDGNTERVYRGYWERAAVRFVEENV